MVLEVAPVHGQHRRGAEIADKAIMVDVHLEAAADQARGRRVEHGADADRGRMGHRDGGGEVRGPVPGSGTRAVSSTASTGAAARFCAR